MSSLTETELKILNAAKKVFVAKGMSGARMQEIADEAGINKSLLHYYFRTKEKLFEAVFKSSLGEFFPKIIGGMLSDDSLEEKIKLFVKEYSQVLKDNPYLPTFILSEVNRNPETILQYFKQNIGMLKNSGMPAFQLKTTELAKSGEINDINPLDLILNMIGMILFPVLAKPILKEVLFDGNEQAFDAFMRKREEHISSFIINSIKKS
ncbi:MAG: TetR/AcrR family transcriptional regulator [Bacteroidetes bacterium]|jgi:TetR/AcrR family transcriptional regulator|nr:TetR/AcrR family transcriptional regulator [Bacteroidota bacterium]MBT5529681.1 TetR/AcrR family transcriptional regulator [Cytophagia bacterium]MBT3423182.1 TetR/AcrR family transcriptional regulator [Bacteroidota bacterium]MBT3802194.1 TetR/AcrR family transcriptional regulator [Bacteroidota bacterium]MBT3935362.1 TetR/AcrR family transcriptional regulator [Bacteroidota bacterium]